MAERAEGEGARTENRRRGDGATRTGKQFWREKLVANKARDRVVNRTLRREGWRVVRIWEHELTKNPQRCVARIRTLFGHR